MDIKHARMTENVAGQEIPPTFILLFDCYYAR